MQTLFFFFSHKTYADFLWASSQASSYIHSPPKMLAAAKSATVTSAPLIQPGQATTFKLLTLKMKENDKNNVILQH